MGKYLLKKFLWGILTIFVIITVSFLLIRLLPTDYYFTADQVKKLTDYQKDVMLEAAGLKDPILVQLKNYYLKLLSGNFGVSRRIMVGVSVTDLIGSRIGISFKIGFISLIISIVIGTLIGIIQTLNKDKLGDYIGSAYTIFMDAVPTVVAYSFALYVGTAVFHLPMTYSSRAHPISSLILPITCMSLANISGYALWTRRYMVDELNKDYIKLAKMKGCSNFDIIVKHVLRNAAVPLVQYLPLSFLNTIGGSMLIDSFFSIPGMGSLFTDAISSYDLDVVQTMILIYSCISVFGIVLGDLLMAVVDPRIKLD